jgi:hypothetical protein
LKAFLILLIMNGTKAMRLLYKLRQLIILIFFIYFCRCLNFFLTHCRCLNKILFICVQDYTEYGNFEECIAYIEDYMLKNGPFDGVLGFSQVWFWLLETRIQTWILDTTPNTDTVTPIIILKSNIINFNYKCLGQTLMRVQHQHVYSEECA